MKITVRQLKRLIKEAVEDANDMSDNQYNFTISPEEIIGQIKRSHIDRSINWYYTTKKIWQDYLDMRNLNVKLKHGIDPGSVDMMKDECPAVFDQRPKIIIDICKHLMQNQTGVTQTQFEKGSTSEYIFRLLFRHLKQYAIDQNKFKTALISSVSAYQDELDATDAYVESKYPQLFARFDQSLEFLKDLHIPATGKKLRQYYV